MIGEPIDHAPYYGKERDHQILGELTLLFLKRIAELGGRPDFQPELAGRRWSPITEKQDAEGS